MKTTAAQQRVLDEVRRANAEGCEAVFEVTVGYRKATRASVRVLNTLQDQGRITWSRHYPCASSSSYVAVVTVVAPHPKP